MIGPVRSTKLLVKLPTLPPVTCTTLLRLAIVIQAMRISPSSREMAGREDRTEILRQAQDDGLEGDQLELWIRNWKFEISDDSSDGFVCPARCYIPKIKASKPSKPSKVR